MRCVHSAGYVIAGPGSVMNQITIRAHALQISTAPAVAPARIERIALGFFFSVVAVAMTFQVEQPPMVIGVDLYAQQLRGKVLACLRRVR